MTTNSYNHQSFQGAISARLSRRDLIKRAGMLGLAVPVAASLLAACGGDDNGDDGGNGGNGDGGGQTITVEMGEMYFDPADISASAGSTITLRADNVGTVVHDWTIDDLNGEEIHIVAEPGETAEATFTVPAEPGEFRVYCTQPGHAAAGMEGTLTVE